VKVEDVARLLNKSPQVIRICLQQGLLPFGTAVKMPNSTQYTYIIYENKVKEYISE
jgi:hypothetical protein